MNAPDRTKRSIVYAIESLTERKVYVGVTVLTLRKRLGLHLANKRTNAVSILDGEYKAIELQADVEWLDRFTAEDAWKERYRADGWDVVSLTNAEIRSRIDNDARMRNTNSKISREQRVASGKKAMGAWTPEQRSAASSAGGRTKFMCETCGMASNAGAVGLHQKRSGHTGRRRVANPPPA